MNPIYRAKPRTVWLTCAVICLSFWGTVALLVA